ncbi:MAG: hypothetical protein CRU78_03950 [Candidatus Accumulibacter phosphatis]|uniref:Uncharacterized protein n=1 Tax=Candidatus Accumulibacter phosphatis TaxID=327160 RepID=A0A6A7RS31_9PROT|nr:hypothetical protein [Candidatus Accumulibacter phosphatis]
MYPLDGRRSDQAKVPETDAIFANFREHDRDFRGEAFMRVSMDCKATVNIGDYSRGGKTRGDNEAADHDMGCEEKHTPFGVVGEDQRFHHRQPLRAGGESSVRGVCSRHTPPNQGG